MLKKPSAKKPARELTRDDQRHLDVEIGFIEGVVRRAPDYVEALRILGDNYTRRGRLTEGLSVDEKLAQLRPEDPTVLYKLACSYSLTNRITEAFNALHRALAAGYSDFKWMAQDPDLEAVRQHPLYAEVRTKIKAAKPKAKA